MRAIRALPRRLSQLSHRGTAVARSSPSVAEEKKQRRNGGGVLGADCVISCFCFFFPRCYKLFVRHTCTHIHPPADSIRSSPPNPQPTLLGRSSRFSTSQKRRAVGYARASVSGWSLTRQGGRSNREAPLHQRKILLDANADEIKARRTSLCSCPSCQLSKEQSQGLVTTTTGLRSPRLLLLAAFRPSSSPSSTLAPTPPSPLTKPHR